MMFAAAAISVLIGCTDGPQHLYRVAITDSVPAECDALVYDAVDAWETAVPGLRFTIVRVHEYDSSDERTIWLSQDAPAPEALKLGRTQLESAYKSSQINITSSGWRPAVLLHEIGHAMELRHTPCGIMQAMHDNDQVDGTVERCDANQYRQMWGNP